MGQVSSKRILLIEADPSVHAEFRRILCVGDRDGQDTLPPALRHVEVDTAPDIAEGLELIEQSLHQGHPYLSAVVDFVGIGPSDALENVRAIWQLDPDLPLLLSPQRGDAMEQRHVITEQLGHIDRYFFLSKPLEPGEVLQKVAVQADRRWAREELEQSTKELQRALQQAHKDVEAADRARNEFIANITHEVRTPMNAILGFARLLEREPLAEGQREKLQYIEEAGTSLLGLIDDVLDYSKLVAGKLKLSAVPLHIGELIRSIFEASRPAAREKGLSFRYTVSQAIPPWLKGDRGRLSQVLVGLVDNAIKFTEQGTVHLQATLDEQTDATATLRITVTDSGTGIPGQRQATMFEGFSQADGSSTRQFGGLGLGLALNKQLVDLMGGQIGFRSTPEQGSSFWLSITLIKHQGEGPPIQHQDLPYHGCEGPILGDRGKPHVLVADDDHLSQTLAEMLLTRSGCLVDLAADGNTAAKMFERSPYDLVLMDLDMPEMDGFQAIEHIRRHEAPAGRHVPIVVLSACATPEDRKRSFEVGADQFITKPFAPESLIGILQQCLPGCLESQEERALPIESHEPDNHMETLYGAQEEGNFRDLDASTAAFHNLSLPTGTHPTADHAMRVQLAARSHDLDQAAVAVRKLHTVLRDRHDLTVEAQQPSDI